MCRQSADPCKQRPTLTYDDAQQIALVPAFLLIIHGLAPLAADAQADREFLGTAEVTARSLNIRRGPSTSDGVLCSIPEGTVVIVFEAQNGWARIRLADGTDGWCAMEYLREVDTPSPSTPSPAGHSASPTAAPDAAPSSGGWRGPAMGKMLKWGSLLGAVALGGLAYSNRSKGNDAYGEYEDLFHAGDHAAADQKYDEATSFDARARLYAIAGGACLGLFILQQFVLGRGETGGKQAMSRLSRGDSLLVCDPAQRSVRLVLFRTGP